MKNSTVLIIGTVWVEPNSSAAGLRMLQLINVFLEQRWRVTFACAAQKNGNEVDLNSLGIDQASVEINSSSFDDFVKELNPSMVIFDRFLTEEQFGWRVVENCPNALRILDTEDLHCLRKGRAIAIKNNLDFKKEDLLSLDITKREIASILRCDLSVIISPYEMDLLIDFFKIDKDILYQLPFLLEKIEEELLKKWRSFEKREHFIFIGNFYHQPNVDAVLQLKKHIWPLIKKQLSKAELHIYGAYNTQQIQELNNVKEGFLIKGFASDAQDVIEKARVLLAPLRFGAGLKGKLLDAMLAGTPSVTTNIGAEGMNKDLPWNGFITDTIDDFADKATTIYKDKEVWQSSQQNGVQIVNQIYDASNLVSPFMKKIEHTFQNLEKHRKNNFLGSLLHYKTLNATKYMSKWIEAKNNQFGE